MQKNYSHLVPLLSRIAWRQSLKSVMNTKDIFEDHGGEKIQLVPSSNDHERFIDGLEEIIRKKL